MSSKTVGATFPDCWSPRNPALMSANEKAKFIKEVPRVHKIRENSQRRYTGGRV